MKHVVDISTVCALHNDVVVVTVDFRHVTDAKAYTDSVKEEVGNAFPTSRVLVIGKDTNIAFQSFV